MLKRELISRATDVLRESGVRKPVSLPKHTFTITDSDGNSSVFKVKTEDKKVIYTASDVKNVIDACLLVVEDAMRNGEEITITGYGTLGMRLRAARKTRQFGTGEWCDVPARYVPTFKYGSILKLAAISHTINEEDRQKYLQNIPDPDYDSDEDFSEDD